MESENNIENGIYEIADTRLVPCDFWSLTQLIPTGAIERLQMISTSRREGKY